MITITLTNGNGSYDITQLVDVVTLSGEYRSCARTLELGLLSSPDDERIPVVDCSVGSSVVLQVDGRVMFSGFVFDRTASTNATTIDLSCIDRGLYLNRNEVSKSYTSPPEAVTRALCSELGITTGTIATTGVTVRRKFFATSIYSIIATMYTEAAKTTGESYQIAFEGDKLSVRTKGAAGRVLMLRGGSNLMTATTTESARNIVNRVIVEDSNGNKLHELSDKKSIAAYGQMQQIIRQSGNTDQLGAAKRMLEARGLEQKITVENLGDTRCITGGAVMLDEPHTRLYGLFHIDADTHTWKNGLYLNKLTLNLKAVMDEQSAGELIGG